MACIDSISTFRDGSRKERNVEDLEYGAGHYCFYAFDFRNISDSQWRSFIRPFVCAISDRKIFCRFSLAIQIAISVGFSDLQKKGIEARSET